jgi:23S rRNA C2498 (ribose-2'-O)-methylase RlmM
MHKDIVKLKVENLQLQTQNAQKAIAIKQLDTQREELTVSLSSYKS